jgi:hypothetical protein
MPSHRIACARPSGSPVVPKNRSDRVSVLLAKHLLPQREHFDLKPFGLAATSCIWGLESKTEVQNIRLDARFLWMGDIFTADLKAVGVVEMR